MIKKQIRLNKREKDRLSRLKGKTGIQNWNILCRWALCYSLSEPSVPSEYYDPSTVTADESDDKNSVEMSWGTFGGEYEEVYELLVKERCKKDHLGTDPDTLSKYFMMHLVRGIAYLSGTNMIHSIDDLAHMAHKKLEASR